MYLPIRLVWNLQMALGQKIAVIALFASGFICIAFATLRIVQICTMTGNSSAPSPTWLALWTITESSIAICIGCGPTFAVLYQSSRTPSVLYDTRGFVRHDQSRPVTKGGPLDTIIMNSVTVGTSQKRASRRDLYWDDPRSSQEELAQESRGIMVTTTLQQDHRHATSTEGVSWETMGGHSV